MPPGKSAVVLPLGVKLLCRVKLNAPVGAIVASYTWISSVWASAGDACPSDRNTITAQLESGTILIPFLDIFDLSAWANCPTSDDNARQRKLPFVFFASAFA